MIFRMNGMAEEGMTHIKVEPFVFANVSMAC
jgi:hypothetical protein